MHCRGEPVRRSRAALRAALAAVGSMAVVGMLPGSLRPAHAVDEAGSARQTVAAVGDQRLRIETAAGGGVLPLYASRVLNGDTAQPDIERAVLVVHGRLRDADVYWRSAQAAARAAGAAADQALLLVPQFLAPRDVQIHGLPADTLRWSPQGWMGGDAALAPAALGSFDALDALLLHLADRRRYPQLQQVVLAGHSGGAQVVQRYAVVGQAPARLLALGIGVRFVVANPSSYLYFGPERPQGEGRWAVPAAPACPGYNLWKYGWTDAPPYARQLSPADYETRYAGRDLRYLLGGLDTNPRHPALDTSCAAETQGPQRLARGLAYVDHLRRRHPSLAHALHVVPGVGHEGDRMLGSACGRAALFDDAQGAAGCAP